MATLTSITWTRRKMRDDKKKRKLQVKLRLLSQKKAKTETR